MNWWTLWLGLVLIVIGSVVDDRLAEIRDAINKTSSVCTVVQD